MLTYSFLFIIYMQQTLNSYTDRGEEVSEEPEAQIIHMKKFLLEIKMSLVRGSQSCPT